MEISFHIPNANTQFFGDENRPPPQVFCEKIMSVANVGIGVEEAIGLNIINLGDVRITDSVAEILQNDDDDAVDPHLERIKNEVGVDESDEEDEDFVIDKDDGGSPTDDSGEEESDASESGDEKKKPAKKDQRKEVVVAAAVSSSKESKKKGRDGQDDGKKNKRKKKDPSAPKRAMTSFFYFSQAERGGSYIYTDTFIVKK
ncbi:FACT complex subunit SSRP1-like [Gossypium arboreum]|uniref:FACT complex subunit SSRP1-like n=1 Tax=Gossypium arboreum TaxID=29729 RepID=UPI0022F1C61E|nr:FACT complex subunit SSRP1-like [Gossypium arboreum]